MSGPCTPISSQLLPVNNDNHFHFMIVITQSSISSAQSSLSLFHYHSSDLLSNYYERDTILSTLHIYSQSLQAWKIIIHDYHPFKKPTAYWQEVI